MTEKQAEAEIRYRLVAEAGLEPTTFGLRLRPGRRRVSHEAKRTALRSVLALWATPLAKTVHRTVFAALTQRASLVGLITQRKKELPDVLEVLMVAEAGLEPTTFGL